ncbi:MAG: 16S rRNA methyltransferase [Desulfurococcales archaeon]|nr:16S rRNA methyltransferase [Desulfurococcales archaeon]
MEGRLRFLLVEASLELAPRHLWGHPEIVATARRYGLSPGDVLLDKSLHYDALKSLPYKWKRGRPDILHITLLNILDSPLAEDGRVEVLFHTIEGRVFAVDPATRLPKHYDRFKGLMAQLLKTGRVPPEGRPLIWELKRPLESVIDYAVLLEEDGRDMSVVDVARLSLKEGAWLVIGVFPRGRVSKRIRGLAGEVVKIYGGRPMKAWTVASRIVCAGEYLLGYGFA